ncbi:hypothetical protein EAH72_02720 [Pseudomonas caspiana]|uniref:Uncharacterized protein n=1 Tax=Pseudomonas mandelii TaxID=75612 RepID=A0A502IIG0_9PSED|nr:hypothetical protein EAH74_09695 [Pseudomonas mandelii]TPG99258.1 hypothetical protein EAH72_02720 [Pseudomonas caspiana]
MGASLLAKALCQAPLMPDVRMPSRAGSLPQVLSACQWEIDRHEKARDHCWHRAFLNPANAYSPRI